MKYPILFYILLSHASICAQGINKNWNAELDQAIAQFKGCENTTKAGVHSCNKYIGRTLKLIYQLNDFYSKSEGRYRLAGEIHDYVQNSPQWTYLGKGYEQEALTKAQQRANEKKAVVAVYRDASGEGHVAYILPGDLRLSGSWRLRVPNSAALFIQEPERSYSNKGLSYSFPRNLIPSVSLYERKY